MKLRKETYGEFQEVKKQIFSVGIRRCRGRS